MKKVKNIPYVNFLDVAINKYAAYPEEAKALWNFI